MRRLIPLLLTACVTAEPTWLEHPCGRGDPVDIQCDDGDELLVAPSIDLCTDEGFSTGDACSADGDRCVHQQAFTCESHPEWGTASEAYLHCRADPWSAEDALCPQSSRSVKQGIVYVGANERAQLAEQVLEVRLARYDYRDPNKPGRRLGYILEDSPDAVFSGPGRVDIYAYLSALVATTQEQQAQIRALQREVAALKRSASLDE